MDATGEGNGPKGLAVRRLADGDVPAEGFAAFAGERRVSPAMPDRGQVEAWLAANRALVSGAMARGWDVPSRATLDRYGRALADAEGEARRKLAESEGMVRIFSDVLDGDGGLEAGRAGEIHAAVARLRGTADACRERLAGIVGFRRRLSEDPLSLFLPVGATVRMKPVARPESWIGERTSPPVPGTIGVVVGSAEQGREGAVMVAFVAFEDLGGARRSGDLPRPLTLYLDADDLELVELGRLADGTPCRSVDFVETHRHEEGRDKRAMEMVVEANGAVWRLTRHREGGTQWVEPQGWADLQGLDFLVPIDAEPASGPRP